MITKIQKFSAMPIACYIAWLIRYDLMREKFDEDTPADDVRAVRGVIALEVGFYEENSPWECENERKYLFCICPAENVCRVLIIPKHCEAKDGLGEYNYRDGCNG